MCQEDFAARVLERKLHPGTHTHAHTCTYMLSRAEISRCLVQHVIACLRQAAHRELPPRHPDRERNTLTQDIFGTTNEVSMLLKTKRTLVFLASLFGFFFASSA